VPRATVRHMAMCQSCALCVVAVSTGRNAATCRGDIFGHTPSLGTTGPAVQPKWSSSGFPSHIRPQHLRTSKQTRTSFLGTVETQTESSHTEVTPPLDAAPTGAAEVADVLTSVDTALRVTCLVGMLPFPSYTQSRGPALKVCSPLIPIAWKLVRQMDGAGGGMCGGMGGGG
jgi:hypothetical protein